MTGSKRSQRVPWAEEMFLSCKSGVTDTSRAGGDKQKSEHCENFPVRTRNAQGRIWIPFPQEGQGSLDVNEVLRRNMSL